MNETAEKERKSSEFRTVNHITDGPCEPTYLCLIKLFNDEK
jgi:hypothetical protein